MTTTTLGSYDNSVISAFSFVGLVLCAIPFAWQLRAWNTGVCLFALWTGLACFIQFVNSIVWHENTANVAPAWCDISSKLIIMNTVAIPAAVLCITHRLYAMTSNGNPILSTAQKRRAVTIDLFIGLTPPILELILHFVVQGHRFDIYEDVGCFPHVYQSWAGYALVYFPPIALCLASVVYATLVIRAIKVERNETLARLAQYVDLTHGRTNRLLYISSLVFLTVTPFNVFVILTSTSGGQTQPYRSWSTVHADFSKVDLISSSTWRGTYGTARQTVVELYTWLPIAHAFIFFATFGISSESRRQYASLLNCLCDLSKDMRMRCKAGLGRVGGSSDMNMSSLPSKTKQRPLPPVLIQTEYLSYPSFGSSFSESTSDTDLLSKKETSAFSPTVSAGSFTLHDAAGVIPHKDDDTAFNARR